VSPAGVLVAGLLADCWLPPQEATAAATAMAKIPCRKQLKYLIVLFIRKIPRLILSGTTTQLERADNMSA
jgi:hypothetical protein